MLDIQLLCKMQFGMVQRLQTYLAGKHLLHCCQVMRVATVLITCMPHMLLRTAGNHVLVATAQHSSADNHYLWHLPTTQP